MSNVETKIKALLGLAGNNPNKAESDSAMKKAFELMAQYNVTEEAINDLDKEEIITLSYPIKNQLSYKGCVNMIVALANYFGVFIYKKKGFKESSFELVGHESKLRSCVAVVDYALQNAKYQMPKRLSYIEKQGYYLGYYTSFKELLAAKQNAVPGLVVSLQQYKQFVGGTFKKASKNRGVSCTKDSYNTGLEAGSKANLNAQLGVRALAAG